MNRWKKWLTTMVAGFTLCVAPVAAVSAASAAQILLYGAASMALARQQLMKMDDQNQKQIGWPRTRRRPASLIMKPTADG